MKKENEIKKLISEINSKNNDKYMIISTDISSMDYLLGGGIQLGSKVQLVAESSTGKSTIALNICRNFCKKKLNVLYVDTENSITREMLISTKCNKYLDNSDNGQLVILKESDFNTVNEYLDKCIKSEYFKLVIIDSLASLVNNCYTDDKTGKKMVELTNSNTNYESRPINLFINKYSALANKYNVAILYINQYRNKVDLSKGTILKEYGNKIVRYNSDVIIKIKKAKESYVEDENGVISLAKTGEIPTHNKLIFTLDKSNKLLTGTEVETYLKLGYGIDEMLDKMSSLIRNSEIEKDGKYYKVNIGCLPQKVEGIDNLITYVSTNKKSFYEEDLSIIDKNDEVYFVSDEDDEEGEIHFIGIDDE